MPTTWRIIPRLGYVVKITHGDRFRPQKDRVVVGPLIQWP